MQSILFFVLSLYSQVTMQNRKITWTSLKNSPQVVKDSNSQEKNCNIANDG